jgi:hypothetical protein
MTTTSRRPGAAPVLRWVMFVLLAAPPAHAQLPVDPGPTIGQPPLTQPTEQLPTTEEEPEQDVDPYWELAEARRELRHAVVRLPLAAGLAAALAFRPRRRGTPIRQAPVIQTQIILALVGAVVMLIVGVSLARAFGIVGVAGLVRYRAKIDDPKDAGVMLATLGIGLASGVGLYFLAMFTTLFIMLCLWIIESFEPAAYKLFNLKIALKEARNLDGLKGNVEAMLRRARVGFELRTSSVGELVYEVKMPLERRTDRLSNQLLKIDSGVKSVEWDDKKDKK